MSKESYEHKLYKHCEEKEANANEVISYLFENENMSEKPLNYSNKAKIISINNRKKV